MFILWLLLCVKKFAIILLSEPQKWILQPAEIIISSWSCNVACLDIKSVCDLVDWSAFLNVHRSVSDYFNATSNCTRMQLHVCRVFEWISALSIGGLHLIMRQNLWWYVAIAGCPISLALPSNGSIYYHYPSPQIDWCYAFGLKWPMFSCKPLQFSLTYRLLQGCQT